MMLVNGGLWRRMLEEDVGWRMLEEDIGGGCWRKMLKEESGGDCSVLRRIAVAVDDGSRDNVG